MYAQSLPRDVDLHSRPPKLDVSIYPQAVYFLLSWSLFSKASEYIKDCASIGVTDVEIRYRDANRDTDPVIIDRFPCDHRSDGFLALSDTAAGFATSRPLAPGLYRGTAYALAGGVEVGASDPETIALSPELELVSNAPIRIALTR